MLNTSVIRIGIIIPSEKETTGGGYSFKKSVFGEIVSRSTSPQSQSNIEYVFIEEKPNCAKLWNIDKSRVVAIHPDLVIYIIAKSLRFVLSRIAPRYPTFWSWPIIGRSRMRLLSKQIHIIWSLDANLPTHAKPSIITIWDLQHRFQPYFPEFAQLDVWRFREVVVSTNIKRAFLCITGTSEGAREIERYYGVEKDRILVNPFPCTATKSDTCSHSVLLRLGVERREYLIYPAQFWPHKNHLTLIKAFQKLQHAGCKLKLVLTGYDRGFAQKVHNWVEALGLNDTTIFTGFLTSHELSTLIENSFALVFPSYFGPDNLPPLEAMGLKVPAVVADVPGSHEQYSDAVLRFDPASADSLCTSILSLYSNKDIWNDLVSKGTRHIQSLTAYHYVSKVENEVARSANILFSINQ